MTDEMNSPRVVEVVSSKHISTRAAHDFMSTFLEAQRQHFQVETTNGDELLIRLEHVCSSLAPPSTTLSLEAELTKSEKKAKKDRKKATKKERKEKRKREKESSSVKKKKSKSS